jgi:serine/threonine-protein kinase RsbT
MVDEPDVLHRWTLTQHEDSYWCSARGKKVALSLGFDTQAAWAVAITISELLSNAIKFAGAGTLSLVALHDPRPGLEIRMADEGPGLEDFQASLRDGYSEGKDLSDPEQHVWPRRGLGAGLGAVKRLMDELEAIHPEEGGLVVIARKFL